MNFLVIKHLKLRRFLWIEKRSLGDSFAPGTRKKPDHLMSGEFAFCQGILFSWLSGQLLNSVFLLQSFFAGRQSHSPVYSVRFNRTTLFVALAQGIRALDFAN